MLPLLLARRVTTNTFKVCAPPVDGAVSKRDLTPKDLSKNREKSAMRCEGCFRTDGASVSARRREE
jgi:hypothetical protein